MNPATIKIFKVIYVKNVRTFELTFTSKELQQLEENSD